MKCNFLIAAILLTALAFPAPVKADDNPILTAKKEFGILTGYGISHIGFGETRHQVQTWDVILRAGFFLSDEIGKDSWYQGRHELVLELPYHMAVNYGGRSMVGGYALGHWRFTGMDTVVPYVFAGGGPLFVDLGLPSMGSKLCFSFQGGTGVQYPISKNSALNLEYRYHHISNADTATPNEPLNSSKILMGISFYR